MAALISLSDIVNRLTGGNNGTPEHLWFFKDARLQGGTAPGAPVAQRLHSLWTWAGHPSGADSATFPTTAANPDNTTQGTLKQTNPGGSRQKWLLGTEAGATAVGAIILYDRLLHSGGLDGTNITAQTVGGTLSRYTTSTEATGNQIWVEIYQDVGVTATTIQASYTNAAGTTGRTTTLTTFGGTGWKEANRIIPLSLQAGDSGVQAVASVTVTATTGTVGNFGVTIARPLVMIPVTQAGSSFIRDGIAGVPAVPEIKTNAALAIAFWANTTTIPQIFGGIHMIES